MDTRRRAASDLVKALCRSNEAQVISSGIGDSCVVDVVVVVVAVVC